MTFVIPTSGDTALIIEISARAALVYTLVANAVLIAAAFCLWEMAIASLRGRPPRLSRWALVAGIALGFGASAALFSLPFVFGTVTFNDELTTTWAFLLESWVAFASVLAAGVLVVLRFIDALRTQKTGRVHYVVWWLTGIAVTAIYAAIIGNDSINGQFLSDAAIGVGIALLAGAAAALLAVAFIHRRRAEDDLPTPRPDRPSRRKASR